MPGEVMGGKKEDQKIPAGLEEDQNKGEKAAL